MRKQIIAIVCLLLTSHFVMAQTPDFQTGLLQAKKESKLVLLNFSGSDWCAPCIKLKRNVFSDPSFKALISKKLVYLNADFPRKPKKTQTPEQIKKNEQLAELYNNKGKFPLTILFKHDGTILKQWVGLPKQEVTEFVKEIEGLYDTEFKKKAN